MELSVAQYLATIDAAAIIVDCNPNMEGPPAGAGVLPGRSIANNTAPLVRFFRANGHAATPIILSEGTPYGTDWASPTGGASAGSSRRDLPARFSNCHRRRRR